ITNLDIPTQTLNGGTWRAMNANLWIDPNDAFDMAINNAAVELSGNSYATDLFQDAYAGLSVSYNFRANQGTFLLTGGADVRTHHADAFQNTGDLLVGNGSSFQITSQSGLTNGISGLIRGEGTIVLNDA